ncbi:Catechol 2,3-dioxygenase [Bradyrhizobium lablabi]|uniref:Catechol 2,3-dioxygenase n=3 Tax=Nitrobacteraceae TaxID=41294 RepID=A0ABY0PEY0_9BRAD|nr:Catechol 2,3-dioxygenase [Bradyrhizobium ottawaense]SED74790.1 Catechol 2,3-dioxygenase [Bradyrhizobium lablabi]SHL70402.1 Catechol 2,3-dioxygenase [Bradyrhizobium lablabi]
MFAVFDSHNQKPRLSMPESAPQFVWDHLHIFTSDAEETARWFAGVLGAEIVRSPVRIEVRFGALRIFVDESLEGNVTNPPAVPSRRGLDHFGLLVKDIDFVASQLKAKGVKFTKEPQTARPGVRMCFIEGPQGISIELIERDTKYKL